MRDSLLGFIGICLFTCAQATTPVLDWSKAIGGKGHDRANGILTDTEGNIIVVGRFQSPFMKIDSLTLYKHEEDHADKADIFIIKLNKNGRVVWGISAGALGDDHALSCATDTGGNIYVVGYFECRTLTFGNISLQNHNCTVGKDSVRYNSDMWVAKFSPEGKCLWAHHAGGLDGNGQYSTIAIDNQNNVLISGIAGGKMDFDNGPGISRKTIGMYVAKYSSNGSLLWAKSPEGSGEAQGVSTDADGNVIIGGYFTSSISFDDITLTSHAEKTGDAFVTKYSSEGKALWARNVGGDKGEIASCETDAYGNVYLAGLFFSKTIVTETDTLYNKGSINHFIVKFDKNGKMIWAQSAGGNNGEAPATATREFYIDEKGNAFCTGSNWSEFLFAGQTVKTVANSEDIFLLKYDSNGKELWGMDLGGLGRNAGRGICTDRKGGVFLTGSFEEKLLKIGKDTLKNEGESDIFIVKFIDL